MKNIARILILILVLSACNKDFNLTTDWEEQMVVYGLIDVRSPVQYLKITKAFLGDGEIVKYAQNPDSNQYNTLLDVKIYELDADNNIVYTFLFDTIHIHNKDSGLFYSPTQIAYKSRPYNYHKVKYYELWGDTIASDTMWLNPDHKYQLDITNPVSGLHITSESDLVDFTIFEQPSIYSSAIQFNNASNTNAYIFKWLSQKNNEEIAQFKLFYSYGEKKYGSEDTIYKKIQIVNDIVVGKQEYKVLSEVFFNNCDHLIRYEDQEIENSIEKRFSGNCELELYLGNSTFYKYLMVNKPSSGLIQEKPIYTNIEGGIGIFGSRSKVVLNKALHNNSVLILKDDYNLKF
jgi:hypothetical protein